MTKKSDSGSDLTESPATGVWCWTDRLGTVEYWLGGVVVAFPNLHLVNG